MTNDSIRDLNTSFKRFGAVPLDFEVELHHTLLPVHDLLALQQGSIISTGKRIGTELTVRIGGAAVAKGELANGSPRQAVRLKSFCESERG